ncbi:RNA polymerase sigma-70 factor [uncultured Sanguibacteroides sp.]|uniref:RNA polymerase sigma-70 factor n=1 Tax=uncultured Sanguibacteroides sp. TaxID=1635151 RepID=UPI0025E7873C|nr:RNA polymerase sigma-70 factor [uncultured Sanguibacteroides sp.]
MSANLLQELKTGDEQAYKRLFRVYYANLVVYASTILKDREVAEDIVQELFINFWYEKKYESINSELERYLFRAIRNNCINYIRNERRHNDRLVRMIVNEKEECKVDLEEMEEREELYRAMNRLPEQCRRIFDLCCVEGMKYQEVANQLGISINTVRTQMARAFKSLRISLRGKSFTALLYFIFLRYSQSAKTK